MSVFSRIKACGPLIAALMGLIASCQDKEKPLFTHEAVMAHIPRGPADCFRQICFDVNEKQIYPDSVLDRFFSEQDPVRYAEFCRKINLDAALLQGIPQAGYATYRQTRVNTVYPGMKGDFFGETLKELHKRGIAGFGYVGIGWVMKYAKEHPEYTDGDKDRPMICLNSPYRDRVMESAREILSNYPVDGFRFDILDQPAACRCTGCRKLYSEIFNDSMPAQWTDWQHRQRFRIESIRRFIKDSYAACKAVKPSVPVWQNWFNGEDYADISDVQYVDMSYLEFTDPFFELFLNGIFDKKGIITGKVIEDPTMAWKCLALGGRCYSYFASVGKTGLPDNDSHFDRVVPGDWFEKKLAPFYARVRDVQSYLENTRPVTNIAILYNEATRYHYDQYKRDDYVRVLRGITEPLLQAGNPVRFISNVNLHAGTLDQYKAVLLPESSGFSAAELEIIKDYVNRGGKLLISGDALCYDAEGRPLPDFALSSLMGVSRTAAAAPFKKITDPKTAVRSLPDPRPILLERALPAKTYAAPENITPVVSRSGSSISLAKTAGNQPAPLVHVNPAGKGFVYYIASSEMPGVTSAVLNYAGVFAPVKNNTPGVLPVLSKRTGRNEWFLHLPDKGKFQLVIDRQYCPATRVTGTYPANMQHLQVSFSKDSIRVDVDNAGDYGIIILE